MQCYFIIYGRVSLKEDRRASWHSIISHLLTGSTVMMQLKVTMTRMFMKKFSMFLFLYYKISCDYSTLECVDKMNPKGSIKTYVVSWRWTQGSFIEIHYSVESIACPPCTVWYQNLSSIWCFPPFVGVAICLLVCFIFPLVGGKFFLGYLVLLWLEYYKVWRFRYRKQLTGYHAILSTL